MKSFAGGSNTVPLGPNWKFIPVSVSVMVTEIRVFASREPAGTLKSIPGFGLITPPFLALIRFVTAKAVEAIKNTNRTEINVITCVLFPRILLDIAIPPMIVQCGCDMRDNLLLLWFHCPNFVSYSANFLIHS